MKMKPVIAIAALAAGLMVGAPGEAEAQYYGHGYGYGSPYSYHQGSSPYRSSYSRYSHDRYKSHPGRGHAYGKYKNKYKSKPKYRHDRHRRPDVSIGPRWDPHHGWVYF